MADTDILVSELPSASQVNTTDLVMLTQVDAGSETGYSTKKGTNLDVFNKALKGTTYSTDLPSFTTKNVLGGMEELKGDISDLLPIDSAGPSAIASFNTALALPLVDCKCQIKATGGYDADTQTPHAIVGYTGLNLTVADSTMTPIQTYPILWTDEAGTVYGGEIDLTTGVLTVTWKEDTIGNIAWDLATGASSPSTKIFRSHNAICKPRVRYAENNVLCSIFYSDASWWFNSNVLNYGMMIDDIGRLYIRDDDYDNDIDNFVSNLGSTVIAYEMPTPYTVQLSATQVRAVSGVNNVYSDCNGNTSVLFKDSIQNYIDKKIAQTQALIL